MVKAKGRLDDIEIPVSSVKDPDKIGFLTKKGGKVQSWKSRYFVLKGNFIYYYKNPKDLTIQGRIDLDPPSAVYETTNPKNNHEFTINTPNRVYSLFASTRTEMQSWIDCISVAIMKSTAAANGTASVKGPKGGKRETVMGTPRKKMEKAREQIDYLCRGPDACEFWKYWWRHVPGRAEFPVGSSVDFCVVASADMQTFTWNISCLQRIYAQYIVDFFFRVGTLKDEIDLLNEVGSTINPLKIGSWIDTSEFRGIDGGWYFPTEMPISLAIRGADQGGAAIKQFKSWVEQNRIETAFMLKRGMGEATPSHSEIRFRLPGNTKEDQLNLAIDAFGTFNFNSIPHKVMAVLREAKIENTPEIGMSLSVTTSPEGFMRIGLLVPRPQSQDVKEMFDYIGQNYEAMQHFELNIETEGPQFVELVQKKWEGGVYNQGFDVLVHYHLGVEVT